MSATIHSSLWYDIPSDDEEAWEQAHAYDRQTGYDEDAVRWQNTVRIRKSRRYCNDVLRNENNSVVYRNVIMCPYPCRFTVMRRIRACKHHITTIATARLLNGVGYLMACAMLGICEEGCIIRGIHRACWCRCIKSVSNND